MGRVILAVMTAGTGVHCCYQHERSRIVDGLLGAGYRNMTVLERLPHDLQRHPVKFRQLVQKEHAVMGKRYLTGVRIGTSSHERHIRNGVMRRTERSLYDQGAAGSLAFIGQTGYRMDLRGLQCLFERQRR